MSLNPSRTCVSGACVKGRVNNNIEALSDDSKQLLPVLNRNHRARFANNLYRYTRIIVLITFEYSNPVLLAKPQIWVSMHANRLRIQN